MAAAGPIGLPDETVSLECSVASRHFDWLRQADADLRLAGHARDGAAHDWACFAAQQAAEKALKAVLMSRGADAWGHTVTALLGVVTGDDVAEELGGVRQDARQALHSDAIPGWPRCGSADGFLHEEGLRRCHRLR